MASELTVKHGFKQIYVVMLAAARLIARNIGGLVTASQNRATAEQQACNGTGDRQMAGMVLASRSRDV
jgi:hypothetical protein